MPLQFPLNPTNCETLGFSRAYKGYNRSFGHAVFNFRVSPRTFLWLRIFTMRRFGGRRDGWTDSRNQGQILASEVRQKSRITAAGTQYKHTYTEWARGQEKCCWNVLEVEKSGTCNTSGGTRDLCHMFVGVTSNTNCNGKHCTFTVT